MSKTPTTGVLSAQQTDDLCDLARSHQTTYDQLVSKASRQKFIIAIAIALFSGCCGLVGNRYGPYIEFKSEIGATVFWTVVAFICVLGYIWIGLDWGLECHTKALAQTKKRIAECVKNGCIDSQTARIYLLSVDPATTDVCEPQKDASAH